MKSEPQAEAIFNEGLKRVEETPEPKGQKFKRGTRVLIGESSSSLDAGRRATVLYTYAHAYPNFDPTASDDYALEIDGLGFSAWHKESNLQLLDPTEIVNDIYHWKIFTKQIPYWEEVNEFVLTHKEDMMIISIAENHKHSMRQTSTRDWLTFSGGWLVTYKAASEL